MCVLTMAVPAAFGAPFSEDFNVDHTANWSVNVPTLTPALDYIADFHYDYSAIGVPSANGSDTRGLKLTCNNTAGVFGGFSVSPLGQSFTGNYTVTFNMWQNYVGPLGVGGSGSTQLSTAGIGTTDTAAAWAGASPQNRVMFGATLDGGSATDYRAYSSAAPTSYGAGNAVYQSAGNPTGVINDNGTYYTTNFPAQSAPAAQLGLYPGQTGTTNAGEVSFKWRQVEINVLNNMATWKIDNVLFATIDLSTVTLGGSNILFGHGDTNSGVSTDANDTLLNVTLIDNINVTPEPATLALLALGGLALRRKR
jgi:hypothetical protein